MDTQPYSELAAFRDFLSAQLEQGQQRLSPEESLTAFRAQQLELARLRDAILPALQRARDGEGSPLDSHQMKEDVTRQLAERGIAD
jgi:hypothetical protein